MQPYLLALPLLFLISCTSHRDQHPNATSQLGKHILADSDVVPLRRDTLLQNGVSQVEVRKAGQPQSVHTLSGDTIVKQADYYHSITHPDINEDGYNDIRITVFSNTPNQCENYFFDKTSGRYHWIENGDLDMEKVKGTDLYFSYNRAGCADMNWESHLTRIENWIEVPVGRIHTKGCGEKDDGIYIYRVKDDKEQLVEKLGIDSNIQQNKWAFIKSYWEGHYRKFL